ncbi:hypothetical protein B7494_g6859 [Chlorociboria aeruginascens]|nr:hypothetical protein B7494_g6859 [Chlorociboria aeruginascens]
MVKDFRSENGLYAMIQAQYDAALQNPPWEGSNKLDIDDRPTKKRRVTDRWFYEVVTADGQRVNEYSSGQSSMRTSENNSKESSRDPSQEPSQEPVQQSQETFKNDLGQTSAETSAETSSIQRHETRPVTPQGCTETKSKKSKVPSQYWYYEPVPVKNPKIEEVIEQDLESSSEGNQPRRSRRSLSRIKSSFSCNDSLKTYAHEVGNSGISPDLPLSRPLLQEFEPVATAPESLSASTKFSASDPQSTSGSSLTSINSQSLAQSTVTSGTSTPLNDSSLNLHRQFQRKSSTTITAPSESDDPPSTQPSQSNSRALLPNLKGKDLFDCMVWSDPITTSIFYMFISSLRQKIQNEIHSTTATHRFIRALRDGGRLVRNYTQNIDSLEEREGLCTDMSRGTGSRARFHQKIQREPRPDTVTDSSHDSGVEVVMLHGNLVSLRCGLCSKLASWDEEERHAITLSGNAPDCPECAKYNAKREGRGRRSLAVGRLRPDIVLYGEEHPNANLVAPLITHDLGLGPDILLIMGTSLRVHGLKIMVKEFAKAVHVKGGKVIFVNQTKPPESVWGDVIDYWVEWDCDAWVLDLNKRRSDIWLPQGTSEESKSRQSGEKLPQDSKRGASRPQALRDDKLNGVHFTFKILDTLGKFTDDLGQQATRKLYWGKPTRSSISSIPNAPTTTPKAKSKSKSARKPKSTRTANVPATSRTLAKATKKRKSQCNTLNDVANAARITEIWRKLRDIAPNLPHQLPRLPLIDRSSNNALPSYLLPFEFKIRTSNQFPNLPGVSWPPMDLISHPPSGLKSHDLPRDQLSSNLDTIVVEPIRSLPTPPVSSDATTPESQRIKRIGRIGTILSSPEPEVEGEGEGSGSEDFYSAEEVIC